MIAALQSLEAELNTWQPEAALRRIQAELMCFEHELASQADPHVQSARLLLADVAGRLGDDDAAYAVSRRAMLDANSSDARSALLVTMAFAERAISMDRHEDALVALESFADESNVPYHHALAISEIQSALGDHLGAVDVLQRALDTGDDSPVGLSSVLQRLGILREREGRLNDAVVHFRAALDAATSLEIGVRATLAASVAVGLLSLGQLDAAADAADRALDLADTSDDSDLRASALLSRGNVCAASGQDKMALVHFNAALVAMGASGSRKQEVVLLTNIAMCYLALGQMTLYVRYLMWALDAAGELEDHAGRALGLSNLATFSPPKEARMLLTEAYAIYLALGDARGEAAALLGLGKACGALGETDDGFEFLTEAADSARRIDEGPLIIAAESERAEAFAASGHAEDAWVSLEEVWAWSERQRRETLAEGVRTRLDHDTASALSAAITLAVLEAEKPQADHNRWLDRLLAMLERTRARALVDRVTAPGLGTGLLPPSAHAALAVAATRIRTLRDLVGALGSADSPEAANLRTSLRHGRKEFDELVAFFDQSHPRYAAWESTDPVGRDWIVENVADNTAVVQFCVVRDRLMSLTVRRDNIELLNHGSATDIGELTDELTRLCATVGDEHRVHEICRRLGSTVMEPLQASPLSGIAHAVVVPTGDSFRMPLEALIVGERHVYSNLAVSYLPAISLGRFLRQPSRLATGFVMADPCNDLLFARDEAVAVSAAFPVLSGGGALLGDEATKAAFMKWAPGADAVHIASHASFSDDAPEFASVQMAGGRGDAALNLEAGDVAAVRLTADLVVLSGCDTGRASSDGCNEMIGLVRAFLCVGAASVVGTRWPVRDAAASEFMRSFYRSMKLDDQHPLIALQRARREHIEGNGYTHPAYWAPYMYFGLPPGLKAREPTMTVGPYL